MSDVPVPSVTAVDHAALLGRSGNDPFIRYDARVPPEYPPVALGSAVAYVRLPQSRHRGPSLTFSGADLDVIRLMQWFSEQGVPDGVRSVTVERQLEPQLVRLFDVTEGGDWNWMWTTDQPGTVAGESEVVTLEDRADAAEITALNAIGNPDAESEPGQGVSEHWVGVRAHGALVGAAAIQRTSAGAPHLTGIVVHPDHRGQGIGVALTANLTRGAVRRDGVATLGVYATNDTARRLYFGLGYQEAHAWSSRRLA